jgi:hypothetical protein
VATGIYGGQCVEQHSVYIFDRGGMLRIAQLLDVSSITWRRDRDGVSEADVRIEGSACSAQAKILAAIEPMRSEMVIFRGNERVWEGPVWRVGWHSTWVEVNAHDVAQYLFGTPLSKAYDNRYRADHDADGNPTHIYTQPTEVLNRIKNILDYEMDVWEALSPPINVMPHVVYHHSAGEPKTTSYTKPYEMTVGEHIAHLAHYSGIDYTTVGRAIHFWDVDQHLGQTRALTDNDFFSEVIITAYGADLTTRAIVISEDGAYGDAIGTTPGEIAGRAYYGPWTSIHTSFNENGTDAPTQGELDSQAQRALAGRNPVPVEVRVPDGSGIRLNETLTIHDMVPGTKMPVLATLNARQMSQMQKLDFLVVTETPDGETIQVTLTPTTHHDEPEDPDE